MIDQQMMLAYYEEHRCSTQWRMFLSSMAEEFEEQLGTPDLRSLMSKIGERFARATTLPACETLDQLVDAINGIWGMLDWGLVSIGDDADYLSILHANAPLSAAFGPKALSWTPAFLEGVYQHWFSVLGIDPALRVREFAGAHEGMFEFRLSR
jgi:hypothetical protein